MRVAVSPSTEMVSEGSITTGHIYVCTKCN